MLRQAKTLQLPVLVISPSNEVGLVLLWLGHLPLLCVCSVLSSGAYDISRACVCLNCTCWQRCMESVRKGAHRLRLHASAGQLCAQAGSRGRSGGSSRCEGCCEAVQRRRSSLGASWQSGGCGDGAAGLADGGRDDGAQHGEPCSGASASRACTTLSTRQHVGGWHAVNGTADSTFRSSRCRSGRRIGSPRCSGRAQYFRAQPWGGGQGAAAHAPVVQPPGPGGPGGAGGRAPAAAGLAAAARRRARAGGEVLSMLCNT